ncbi:hypothetical protein F8O01_02625 [Pseudoclavibacter chungangensis]|uniref:Uncharacterized protein n=1 Tax=Pseudoclavibacter chungangensis TaxID=587635 RepID=A0A7J5C0J4_9MICO|nr:hypothetical protein [Pseudoclavibacter chungangensis]KAB1660246.1 hypothetical protein F8O01_02625 [Pseudoclavibacter chungangensis]NYJ65587.1 hypothetical protein [Pseudoclavibacter chungangensis]
MTDRTDEADATIGEDADAPSTEFDRDTAERDRLIDRRSVVVVAISLLLGAGAAAIVGFAGLGHGHG